MTAAADFTLSGVAARSARVASTPVARRRPSLELVATGRPEVPRAPFVAVVVSLLAAGLLGLLVLNTVLAQDAFALHTLTQTSRELADREQTLAREVEALRSPQALAAKATELGMVQAGPPAFLRLPDGAVLGAALPALAPGEVRGPDGEVVPVAPEPQAADRTDDEAGTDASTDDVSTDDAGTDEASSEDGDEASGDEASGDDASGDDASTGEARGEGTSTGTTDETPAGDDR